MEGHAGDDDVGTEQQRALDQEGALIVQQVVPPLRRDELRQHDRDIGVAAFPLDLVDVFQQRFHQRSERRVEHDESRVAAPGLPVLLQRGDLLGVVRSEEHTSELQSQSNLVCRLLLEKKKKKKYI